jgi:hypothetical protein
MVGFGSVELAVVLVLVLLAVLVLGGPGGRRRRAASFARRAGLPAVTPELVRRVTRRRRFVVGGTLLGCAAAAVLGLWLVPIYAGLAAGAVLDALTRPGPPPGGPRVAHETTARLTDYVPAWVLALAVTAAGTAPVLALVWLTAPRTEPVGPVDRLGGGEVGWLVLAAGAGLAVSLALARFVLSRPQPAGSPEELDADDALRAQGVRDVLQVTAVTSFAVGWVLCLGLQEPEVTGVARHVGGVVPVVLLAGIVGVGWVHELTGGPRHWRSRRMPVA